MKTIETLYNEILESDGLKKEFAAAVQEKKLEAFLKENGCDAGEKEVQEFLAEKQSQEGAISDVELNSASGGCSTKEALLSTVTAGVYCLIDTAISIQEGSLGDSDSGRLMCPTI